MNTVESGLESFAKDSKPGPQDFNIFIPWAVAQLQIDLYVVIETTTIDKTIQLNSAKSTKPKTKTSLANTLDLGTAPSDSERSDEKKNVSINGRTINIIAAYDANGNLTQLKFHKCRLIPCKLLKILELVLPYHKQLTCININQGIDYHSLYELSKLVNFGVITDVCLDDTAVPKGCYELLLEKRNKLRNLSLARCKFGDETLTKIASYLMHPLPASYTLQTLNLASNCITDVGAVRLGVTLRSNRQIVYLNLADNLITDHGAIQIFDALSIFLVSYDEIIGSRRRKIQYLKEKDLMTYQILEEMNITDVTKKTIKKKTVGKKKEEIEISTDDLETDLYERAKNIAEDRLGEFSEPFSADKIFMDNGLHYCYGNNVLAYINISYNHINYVTVKKIISVLLKQQELKRKPLGLINVSVEGNNLPKYCVEFDQISAVLRSNMSSNPRKTSALKSKK